MCKIEGNIVKLPYITLNKIQFKQISDLLEKIGGVWSGKSKGFICKNIEQLPTIIGD